MKIIRVVLADDHCLFRAGLRALLNRIPDVSVVGEAGTGREALQMIQADPPHIVLMDIMMPELNGLDATAHIAAICPAVSVLMLSMNSTEEYVHQALRAGAMGYLLKNVSPCELEEAIRRVARGELFVSPAIPKLDAGDHLTRLRSDRYPLERLTSRQREVLQLVVEGFKTKAIAMKLELSIKTVEMHRSQMMRALDIHDIPGLVRYAIRAGLISN